MKSFLCLLIFGSSIQSLYSANILALLSYPLKSHFIIFDALLVELANRGHNITMITPYPKSKPIPNYNEIDISTCYTIPDYRFAVDFSIKNLIKLLNGMLSSSVESDKLLLQCESVQQLIQMNGTYDLLITELFTTDIYLAIVHKFQKPFIQICTLPIVPWGSFRVGNIDNPSYIPITFNDYSFNRNGPSFLERLYNVAVYCAAKFYHWMWTSNTDKIIREVFDKDAPSVHEISKNTSLIFTFSHFSLTSPRPHVPAVIEVGGLHIKKPNSLPKDIENFINESTDGVIYFCLGSLIHMKTLRPEIRNAFVNAFKQIPQRVLWKWESDELPDKPANVMIKKWMPQRDILARPEIKVFITHGGLLGLNEAVYEGVPIIGIPLYADQPANVKIMESNGAGIILPYAEITTENVLNVIRTVLNNKTYAENAKRLSALFKDRPMTPMDTAVYWTEYVIRHKGAKHLRTAALNLSWYQYLLLDVFLFLAIVLLVTLVFIKIVLSFSINFICTRFKQNIKKLKKN